MTGSFIPDAVCLCAVNEQAGAETHEVGPQAPLGCADGNQEPQDTAELGTSRFRVGPVPVTLAQSVGT